MKAAKKKSKIKASTVILAGLAVAGAYGLYSMYSSPVSAAPRAPKGGPGPVPGPSSAGSIPAGMPGTGPDLSGPRVQKGVVASTHAQNLISAKYPGMIYARITKTDNEGYKIFKPTVNGIFTRRILAIGGRMWAEIKPG